MTIITPRIRLLKAAAITAVISVFSLLVACVDSAYSVANLQNGKRYVGLHNESVPAGVEHPKMPETIKINYSKKPASLAVYLNGQSIGERFTFGESAAEVAVNEVKELLKQGKNVLLVDPLAFGPTINFIFDNQGPIMDVTEVEDVSGAYNVTVRAVDTVAIDSIKIERINYQWDGGTDNSQSIDFKTDKITPTGQVTHLIANGDGTWTTTSSITPASMYLLTATDAYGFVTEDYYLAPDEKINNVFKLKLDKSVLDDAVPLALPMMKGMHMYSKQAMDDYGKSYPSDPVAKDTAMLNTMNRWWSSSALFYGNDSMGAATSNEANCGYIDSDVPLTSQEFQCGNIKTDVKSGAKYCLPGDLKPIRADAKVGRCTRIVVWRLELDEAENLSFTLKDTQPGTLNLNVNLIKPNKPRALYADLGMRHIQCGSRHSTANFCKTKLGSLCLSNDSGVAINNSGQPTQALTHTPYHRSGAGNAFCKDDGAASMIISLGDMKVVADKGNPKGDIKATVKDGAIDLSLAGFSLNLDGLGISGGSGLIDAFLPILAGVLDGLFVDIIEGVLKQNMQDFKLGFDLFTEWDEPNDPSMRMQSQAYQVWTNADNNASTPLYWYMYYAGFLKAIKQHPEVPLLLGSRYVTEEVLHPANTGSEIDMAINVNIINQALMSMYRSGVTHITVTNLKVDGKALVHFGPSISDSYPAQHGDMRVELVPHTPGLFEMAQGDTGTQATLYYRNAQMLIETYRNGSWETDFDVAVDIRAGVLMNIAEGEFRMTILGTPELTVNSIQAKGANKLLPDNVLRQLVQFGVDLLMTVAVPQISDTFAGFRIPALPVGDAGHQLQVTSEGLEANNGKHLGFGFGLSVEQVAP